MTTATTALTQVLFCLTLVSSQTSRVMRRLIDHAEGAMDGQNYEFIQTLHQLDTEDNIITQDEATEELIGCLVTDTDKTVLGLVLKVESDIITFEDFGHTQPEEHEMELSSLRLIKPSDWQKQENARRRERLRSHLSTINRHMHKKGKRGKYSTRRAKKIQACYRKAFDSFKLKYVEYAYLAATVWPGYFRECTDELVGTLVSIKKSIKEFELGLVTSIKYSEEDEEYQCVVEIVDPIFGNKGKNVQIHAGALKRIDLFSRSQQKVRTYCYDLFEQRLQVLIRNSGENSDRSQYKKALRSFKKTQGMARTAIPDLTDE